MGLLNQTPRAKLTDAHGRPYFLWDCDMTLAEFERARCVTNRTSFVN